MKALKTRRFVADFQAIRAANPDWTSQEVDQAARYREYLRETRRGRYYGVRFQIKNAEGEWW